MDVNFQPDVILQNPAIMDLYIPVLVQMSFLS